MWQLAVNTCFSGLQNRPPGMLLRAIHMRKLRRSSIAGGIVDLRQKEVQNLEQDWAQNPRWNGVKRGYGAKDVVRLRGSVKIEHTLARRGAEKLWRMMHERPFVNL